MVDSMDTLLFHRHQLHQSPDILLLSPVIAAQYHLTHTDLAKIIGAFQLSYALTWLIGGIFLDLVGTRIGLIVTAVW
jgi:MFS transporter, ACS family, hexuronate transporter